MKSSKLISSIVIGAACFAFSKHVNASTVQTFGAGSAVQRVDRSATFDKLNYGTNGTPLSDYTESSLFLRMDGDSWVGDGTTDFDPFHGANGSDRTFEFPYGGSYGWVTIETTDSVKIFAVEFMYGNGWTTGGSQYPWGNDLATVEWQTWNGGSMVSSGILGGPMQIVEMGTIIGFCDSVGFDQLLVKCRIAGSVDPNLQGLAWDNVEVQLLQGPPPVCRGDFNCDRRIDFTDIDAFVAVLSGGPCCDPTGQNCDVNGDGAVNFADIDPFVALLSAGATCP